MLAQDVVKVLARRAILRLLAEQRAQRLFGLREIFVMTQYIGTEQFGRCAARPALLSQRSRERQRLANIALLVRLLSLGQLPIE